MMCVNRKLYGFDFTEMLNYDLLTIYNRQSAMKTLALVLIVMPFSLAPCVQSKSVAIIGGGMAGLSCAQRLTGYDVTVFDTGKFRPGGRCSSRYPSRSSNNVLDSHVYDHAAQILSVPSDKPEFARQVKMWRDNHVIERYPANSVYEIRKGQIKALDTSNLFYGKDGMGLITQYMAKHGNFQMEQDVWVSPNNGVRYNESAKKWSVQGNNKKFGEFDHLVIAHNGKCADRLMSRTPCKAVHQLLRVNFAPTVPEHGGKRMTLNSIYSLTFAVASPSGLSKALPDTFYAGYVNNNPLLKFIACQTSKYPSSSSAAEVWTVLSTSQFAKKHKAPQEFLPDETLETVTGLLIDAVEETFDIKLGPVLESKLQLWGAAVPLNVWGINETPVGFLFDNQYNVGVCGDWLMEPSLSGAWDSGRLLADHMNVKGTPPPHGLTDEGTFQKSDRAAQLGIGSL